MTLYRQKMKPCAAFIATLALFLISRPVLATEQRLETENLTADQSDGTNNYINIGVNDRSSIYAYPSDTLSDLVIKLKNATGHNCAGVSVQAFVNDAEITSDVTSGLNIDNGGSAEVEIFFTAHPDIILNTITKFRLSVSSCWNGLTYFHTDADVWGSDGGTNYGGGGDPYIKIYGLAADTRPDPTTTIYDPPDDTHDSVAAWNAPFTFRATTDINADDYPDEGVIFNFRIYQDGDLVYTSPALPYLISNTFYNDNYAILWPSGYLFADGHDYEIEARARDLLPTPHDWGSWSDKISFTATDYENTQHGSATTIFNSGDGNEPDICAHGEGWSYDPSETIPWNLVDFFAAFIPSIKQSFWDFFWVSCDTYKPITDLRRQLSQHAPFRQALWLAGTLLDALDNTEAPADPVLTIQAPPPWSDQELVLFDPDAIYTMFGGAEGWGTLVRPTLALVTLLALAFYFWHEAKSFFVGAT